LTLKKTQKLNYVSLDLAKRIYKRQLQGAFVWWGSITTIWILLLVPYFFGRVDIDSFKYASILFVFGYLMYLPILWAVKRATRWQHQELIGYLVNALQLTAQLLLIYLMGGLRVAYLCLVYAPVIGYVGMVAPRRFPFLMAIFCVITFSLMVTLEHLGVIPHQNKMLPYNYGWEDAFVIVFLINALLFVVAFVSAYTADLLKKARNKAREAERMKAEFLANMSHEIRTPMNAVTGFTDMLLDTDLDEDQIDYARMIQASGDALLSLIDDILDFSKIEAQKMDFDKTDFDPELLAYDVCEQIRPGIGSKPIEVICHIGDNIPSNVNGDPHRFRQVLTNLISNACKFTEAGEIELSVEVEEEKDDWVKLHATIRDTGIGIPKDKLSTIFTSFQQADGSTTRKYGGTGLGLAICKQISNLMDGDIWAESEADRGSKFHFTAWLLKAEDREAKRFATVSLAGKKCLVVDDNQTNLDILKRTLALAGMRVVALRRPQEVMQTLQEALEAEDNFDVCVSDILMPEMSGYDLARKIRDPESQFSNLPLIALSSSIKRDAKRCQEAGFDGFLIKPCRREKLFQMIERIVGERQDGVEKAQVVRDKIMTQYGVREEMKHYVQILLAEDNPVNQKLAEMMLTKAGYQVAVANDGCETLEKYTMSPEEFDLIFMDVQMPGMDGLEVTKAIREKGFNKIPIVAMTAHAMKGDRKKCLDAGMDDYITKPIKRKTVFEILEKWVLKTRPTEFQGIEEKP
jgi:signal transduction histidine kinase/DNA-binding response OmpR family regulator